MKYAEVIRKEDTAIGDYIVFIRDSLNLNGAIGKLHLYLNHFS